ncbi:MFS transporter [Actinoplanes sp. TRM 88003]|uniref:MFS transporter n=1 Tax=Paractinoplanes aksuensis TaxID=2939490 RepID=A0ABT1DTI9_9ACTN|nr:MFS transporter [Actinoplanes aksuensis]MCO8273838.1 MFS transporter [Actinoplanes aksuensis]
MSMTETGTPVPLRWSSRLWGVLAVLCIVVFLDGLDISNIGVALPSIGAELGLSTTSLQWVVNGYVLGFGGLLLLGGRTADLLGRRRVFLVAVAVFTVASLIGGLVDDGGLLIATRFIMGLAAAFTAPTALSILTTTFPEGPARNKALAIFTAFSASGFSSGLILGGVLTNLGWRWNFLVPVPLALAALIGGMLLIARDRPPSSGGQDLGGAVTLTAGMLLTVYAVVTTTWGLLIPAAALLAAFVVIENRVRHPLVRLGILRTGSIVRANVSLVVLMGSYVSFQFIMTLYLQDVLGWSPLKVALAILPLGLVVVFGSPYVGKLVSSWGTGRLIAISMALLTLSYLWILVTAGSDPHYLVQMLPTMLLNGAAFAFGYGTIITQATDGVADHEQGLASGLVQTSGQVGTAMVLAVVSTLVATATATGSFTSFRPGLITVTAVAAAGLVLNLVPLLTPGRRIGA